MHKTAFAILVLTSLAGGCASAPPAAHGSERPPNIVLIVADDLGWAELSCYGQQRIHTPRIDRMAREGLRFTQFYSGAPVCAPSRCTLLTGKHTGHAAIRDNLEIEPEGQAPLPDAELTLAEALRSASYTTAITGKWGLGAPGSEGEPNKQGFDSWFGYLCQREAHNYYPDHLWRDGERVELAGNSRGLTGEQYSHDLFTDEALRFIRDSHGRPFFLFVAYTIPHLALQVPQDSLSEYCGLWEDPPYEGGQGYLPHPAPRAAYAAMVTRLDRDVGRILDLLAELELEEDTLVLFTSDNGPTYDRIGGSDSEFFQSVGPLRGLKGSTYEGGIRVPLVVRWPGRVPPGRVSQHVSAFWDVMPTVLEAAGIEVPAHLDGISFLPTLEGREGQREHEYLYWELRDYGGQQALRMGDWKGVIQGRRTGNHAIELYDLAGDPGETRDVASQHPELVERLRALLSQARSESALFPLDG